MSQDQLLKLMLEKLEKVESKVINSPAMNGGFDKLLGEVGHIKDVQGEVFDYPEVFFEEKIHNIRKIYPDPIK